ncbi:RidA family protein [Desertibacillus haloalkaliphilus]|uniref:RidA family protein n=1 Tax=Desertibacillus haloalkaliphilus TaxID=1328930 RepID=UPI001C256735|nr:RidA family protein [Desertibacillus haloalkaliphilus]MBU8908242.1 RidA family protein [Desertibacillus haloalkaliphilus]
MLVTDIEQRLSQLGWILPEPPKQSGNYVLAKKVGNLLYISGVTCKFNGVIKFQGKVGHDITIDEAYEAAKVCALNHLSLIRSVTGDLNKVKNIIKMVGYVNCDPDFADVPKVINGASDLLIELFGEKGKHARCAVGVASLPGLACAETDLIVEIDSH